LSFSRVAEDFFVFLSWRVACVLGFVFGLVIVLGSILCGFCVVYNVVMRDLFVV
jgi:hypothetical protein